MQEEPAPIFGGRVMCLVSLQEAAWSLGCLAIAV
jgi:hypothetical protein